MPTRKLSTAVVVLMVMFISPLVAEDGKVSGTMKVNGKSFDLSYVYVTPRENPFDKAKTDLLVIVTDKPLPAAAVHDEFEMMKAKDDLGLTGFTAQINAENQINTGTMFSPNFTKMKSFSGSGMQEFSPGAVAKDRLAGKISMAKEHDFFDEKYQFNVTFDAPVVVKPAEAPLPGKPLPKGGGEPVKAYMSYRKALMAGDVPALRKHLTAGRAKETESEEFKQFFPLVQEMTPKKVTLTGGAVDGDKATLLFDASTKEEKRTGKITMVKEGGAWKVEKESWSSRSE